VRLSTGERTALAELGQKLGKQALEQVATIVKPDTILAWHRKLVTQKFDGSQQREAPGRPKIDQELEAVVVRMAQENRSWGYGFPEESGKFRTLEEISFEKSLLVWALRKRRDTVGELGSVENWASRMASCKAHDHGNACAERLAQEGGNRFANSIRRIDETQDKAFLKPRNVG
jgi:hypothetical protein